MSLYITIVTHFTIYACCTARHTTYEREQPTGLHIFGAKELGRCYHHMAHLTLAPILFQKHTYN